MANSYLTHTHGSSATLLTKGTFSAWVKRSAPTGEQTVFTGNNAANNQRDFVRFEANSQLRTRGCGGDWNLETTQLFRDTSAWYHIVVSIDTTQNTASDRIKMYVNGSQVTAFNSPSYPSQSYTFEGWSNQTLQTVGRDGKDANTPFDGYMSHVIWVDGTALTPTSFGETDATSGIWKFKSPSGVTWGTNGFHLKMENSAALGTDSSGNSNTFTVNGNLKQALDTPSNVYAVYNSLSNTGVTLTQGNLTGAYSTNDANIRSTLGVSTGKWYWETKFTTGTSTVVGVCNEDVTQATNRAGSAGFYGIQNANTSYAYYRQNGSTGQTSAYPNPVQGNIINFALDLDNSKIYIGINGVYKSQAGATSDIANGTNPFFSSIASSTWFPILEYRGSGTTTDSNFGNGFFGTTAITSAGSNGNGSLFEYDVPTGYYALNTKNINTYG